MEFSNPKPIAITDISRKLVNNEEKLSYSNSQFFKKSFFSLFEEKAFTFSL